MQDIEDLVDGHLSELALEALAGEREDLLATGARAHLDVCAACAERVADARLARSSVSAALRVELGEGELDALVRAALEAVPHAHTEPTAGTATQLRPSRRSLLVAATLGTLASLTLGALSLDRLPSVGRVLSLAHEVRAIAGATDRLVDALVPGGWGALALVLSGLLAALLVPLRALAAPRSPSRHFLTGAGTLTLGLLLGLLVVPRAQALEFTGDWPDDEHLTVVADGVPASVALERAAQAAGLGFIGALATDPPTHLRVRNASLREIVTAVLGSDAPLVAERTATLLVVRRAEAQAAPPTVAPPTLPTSQSSPPLPPRASADARRRARERVSFGGDVTVRAGEVVESVVTMGGSATIEGEVLRDVVTMGGSVHVRRGGIVHGEIVAMGGEIRVDEGAQASARVELAATPGGLSLRGRDDDDDDDDDDAAVGVSVRAADAAAGAAGALAGWLRDTLASASRHALLFLFGLLLLGLAPARLDTVTRAVATLPARAAAIGVLSGIAAAVLGVVLLITIIGIPGAVLLALGAALGVYAGLVAVAAVIGRILPIRALEGRAVLQLAAGVLVLFLVSRVPLVGGLAPFVAALVGLGAVVVTRAGTRPA